MNGDRNVGRAGRGRTVRASAAVEWDLLDRQIPKTLGDLLREAPLDFSVSDVFCHFSTLRAMGFSELRAVAAIRHKMKIVEALWVREAYGPDALAILRPKMAQAAHNPATQKYL